MITIKGIKFITVTFHTFGVSSSNIKSLSRRKNNNNNKTERDVFANKKLIKKKNGILISEYSGIRIGCNYRICAKLFNDFASFFCSNGGYLSSHVSVGIGNFTG